MKDVSFRAPWGVPLTIMTIVTVVVCLTLPVPAVLIGLGTATARKFLGMTSIPPLLQLAGWVAAAVPILTVFGCAIYMVRGYVLTESALFITRPGWRRTLNLAGLTSAKVDPEALRGSFRIFGNGGCFGFVGWFRNKTLGVYRAYATDSTRAVVLRFADKTVVVTPDDPQGFVAEITARLNALH